MSKITLLRQKRRKLKALEKQSENDHKWLMENINHDDWVAKKRDWNMLQYKIENLRKEINDPGIWKRKDPDLQTTAFKN